MSLGVNEATEDRTLAQVTWAEGDFEGEVNFSAINPNSDADDKDVSTKQPVDASVGAITFTFPEDYTGESIVSGVDANGTQHAIKLTVENGAVVSSEPVDDD